MQIRLFLFNLRENWPSFKFLLRSNCGPRLPDSNNIYALCQCDLHAYKFIWGAFERKSPQVF